jgi:hypothetical protein
MYTEEYSLLQLYTPYVLPANRHVSLNKPLARGPATDGAVGVDRVAQRATSARSVLL